MFSTGYTAIPTTIDQGVPVRAATPITPIHTPHHSLSSMRSHTPGQALSLHEYRKQQATPSSVGSSVSSERRLKRRRGASGLNVIERVPSQRSLVQPSSSSKSRSTRRLQSLLPPAEIAGPTFFFSHIPPPPSSLASASPPQPHHAHSRTPSLFTNSSSTPATALDSSRLRDRTKNFKSIKHLPRREASQPEQLFATVSFSQPASASGSPALEARPATSSPTVSLSKFPQPPRRIEPTPLATTTELLTRPTQPQQSSSEEAAPQQQQPHSAPPTVLHYRGVSFDLVNPHQSLLLSCIETPEPVERDSADYFNPATAALSEVSADMAPRLRRNTDAEGIEMQPPSRRALYDDFASAHESITTRSIRSGKSPTQSNVNLPQVPAPSNFNLPQIPEPVMRTTPARTPARTPTSVGYQTLTSNDDLPATSPHRGAFTPARSTSIRDRLSRAWHRGMDTFRVMNQAIAQQGGEVTNLQGQQLIAGIGAPSQSAPYGFHADDDPFDLDPGNPNRISESLGDIGMAHTLRDYESHYPSSTYLRQDSELMYPESLIDLRHSVPYGRRTGQTDYSSEAGVHGFDFDFDPQRNSRNSRHSSFPLHAHRESSTKDTTINNIINEYGDTDVTDTSLIDLHDDENAIQISPHDLVGNAPTEAQISATSLNTNTTTMSSQNSSSSPSPKTPEMHAFVPGAHVFHTSSGVPPPISLPLMGSLPAFVPRFQFNPGSGLSDITSGESYGDTRQLLLLSQQFAGGNGGNGSGLNVMSEQATASSQTLPGVQDDNEAEIDRMSPDTMIRMSPLPLNPRSPILGSPSIRSPSAVASTPRVLSRASGRSGDMLSNRPTTAHSNHAYELAPEYPEDYFAHGRTPTTPRRLNQIIDEEDSAEIEFPRGAANTSSPLSSPLSHRSYKSSGVPVMWAGNSPRLFPMEGHPPREDSPGEHSYADMDTEDEEEEGVEYREGDWETVGSNSKQTLQPEGTMSSMADYSDASFMVSQPMFQPHANYGIGELQDNRSSYYSEDAIPTVPAQQEHLHDLAASSRYQPAPLAPGYQHPFQGTPSVHLQSTPTRAPTVEFAESPRSRQASPIIGNNAQPTHAAEPTESTGTRPQYTSWNTDDFFVGTTRGPHTMSQLLTAGPNEDIIYDNDPNVLGNMRDMSVSPEAGPSSPLPVSQHAHEDSFSKFTVLGPKANLTGTPLGTGMREAGSSLANSSTPGAQWSSTPVHQFESSPLVQMPSPPTDEEDAYGRDVDYGQYYEEGQQEGYTVSPLESPQRSFPGSPVTAKYFPSSPPPKSPTLAHAEAPSPLLPKSKASSRGNVETGNLVELREIRRREREERRLAALRHQTALNSGKRASVSGQTELREMQLVRNKQVSPISPSISRKHHHSTSTVNTHFSQFAGPAPVVAARRDSSDTGSPLFDTPSGVRSVTEQLRQQASEHDQHLYNIPLGPITDAETKNRRMILSWFLFGCAAVFPPLLILYRFGGGDALIAKMTDEKILTVNRVPKQLSLYLGITLCTALPILAIILVVLFHFGVIFH
ncbi:hypothetical protein NA57DRAFT_73789 [Rhizodiscina lignyota]|uniref:Uncharacterized protein n=1 Tax=Rhizodiscina lignyota TaxID=1504668 RepID=A0A9P4IE68_9PEZI|nr:hypothetical protein NA57DRAFT_73789 [Rhizodiscina lignyota]